MEIELYGGPFDGKRYDVPPGVISWAVPMTRRLPVVQYARYVWDGFYRRCEDDVVRHRMDFQEIR